MSNWLAFRTLALSDGCRSGRMLDVFSKLMEEVVGMVSAAVLAMCEETLRSNTSDEGRTLAVAGFIVDVVLFDHLADGSIEQRTGSTFDIDSTFVRLL